MGGKQADPGGPVPVWKDTELQVACRPLPVQRMQHMWYAESRVKKRKAQQAARAEQRSRSRGLRIRHSP